MNQVKQVVFWEPKRAPNLSKNGKPTKKEFVGKFRTKVQAGTPNAVRHQGENAAGVKWDFWGLDVDNVFGKVRWIDVRTTDFGPKIVLFLETEKRLNQITIDYDVNNIHDIMNVFLGLGNDLATAEIAASYWVRKKTDREGKVKTDANGKPFWAQSMTFRYATEAVNIPGRYNFDEWKKYSEENGLAWFQEERAGKKIWNYEAELKFWMGKVADVQRFLLKTETVLPFCWNSVTACETGALKDELPHLNNIYESIKPLYQFPFRGVWTNSENVELAPPAGYDPNNAAHAANPFDTDGDFPTVEAPATTKQRRSLAMTFRFKTLALSPARAAKFKEEMRLARAGFLKVLFLFNSPGAVCGMAAPLLKSNMMLTKEEIQKMAAANVLRGEAPLWGGGFVEGATWANEQNAAEIARLKQFERQYAEYVLSLNNCLENAADLRGDLAAKERTISELRAALIAQIEAAKTYHIPIPK